MQKDVVIGIAVELIGNGTGVGLQMTGIVSPTIGWVVIVASNAVGFFLIGRSLSKSETVDREGLRDSILSELRREGKSVKTITRLKGSLDDVPSQDKLLIQAMAMDMAIVHGHLDLDGLLADRASGIPLNELKRQPCSVCGVPRDRKSHKWSKEE
jgi:hypothetical protein